MNPTTRSTRFHIQPPGKPTRDLFRVIEGGPSQPRQRPRAGDNLLFGILIACSCVFAGALAVFALYPAVTSFAQPSAQPWGDGGP